MSRRVIKKIFDVKLHFYTVYYGVRNLVKWLPVIWKDRDWDSHFLMVILIKKLKQMEELHRYHGHTANAELYANQMKEVREALERLDEDDYLGIHDREDSFDFIQSLTWEDLGYEGELVNKDLDKAFDGMKNIRYWWD